MDIHFEFAIEDQVNYQFNSVGFRLNLYKSKTLLTFDIIRNVIGLVAEFFQLFAIFKKPITGWNFFKNNAKRIFFHSCCLYFFVLSAYYSSYIYQSTTDFAEMKEMNGVDEYIYTYFQYTFFLKLSFCLYMLNLV